MSCSPVFLPSFFPSLFPVLFSRPCFPSLSPVLFSRPFLPSFSPVLLSRPCLPSRVPSFRPPREGCTLCRINDTRRRGCDSLAAVDHPGGAAGDRRDVRTRVLAGLRGHRGPGGRRGVVSSARRVAAAGGVLSGHAVEFRDGS